jgi:hypothetical protein
MVRDLNNSAKTALGFNFYNKNIIVGMSCIPKNYDTLFIHQLFKTIKNINPKNLIVMYADELQRHSFLAFTKDSKTRIDRKIAESGIKMRSMIEEIGFKYLERFEIMNWREFCSYSGEALSLFQHLYERIESFKILINKLSLIIYNTRTHPPKLNYVLNINSEKIKNIRHYIMEELLAATRAVKIGENLYDTQIYPINSPTPNDQYEFSKSMLNGFSSILVEEIIPFLHNMKPELYQNVFEEFNKLNPTTKKQIFESKKTNFLFMLNSGILHPIE